MTGHFMGDSPNPESQAENIKIVDLEVDCVDDKLTFEYTGVGATSEEAEPT